MMWLLLFLFAAGLICLALFARRRSTRSNPTTVLLDAEANFHGGFQAGVFGPGPEGGQKFGARRQDWNQSKDFSEIDTATRFNRFVGLGLVDFEKTKLDDDADVTARSSDGSTREEFQVTVLWHGPFWQQLNTTGATRDGYFSGDQMRQLILDAVERKTAKYTTSRRQALHLLIDTNPVPVLGGVAASAREALQERLSQAGFKSVWLVGSELQHTHQLR